MFERANVINGLLLQVLWLACVLGAGYGHAWLGIPVLAAMLLHLSRAGKPVPWRLVILLGLVGTALDSSYAALGWIHYQASYADVVAPLWITLLWLGTALTIPYGMRWFFGRPLVCLIITPVCAVLSYLAGRRLEALDFSTQNLTLLIALALTWTLLFWWLGRQLQRPTPLHLGDEHGR